MLDLDIEDNCWCEIPIHLPHPTNVELQVQLAELYLLHRKQQQQQKLASTCNAWAGICFVPVAIET